MKLSLENCIELVTGKGTWHTRNCGGKVPVHSPVRRPSRAAQTGGGGAAK